MESPTTRLDNLRSSSEFLFIVFYRGSWCPFCTAYLTDLQSIVERVTAAKGRVLTITAESAEKLALVRTATQYSGEAISDPDHAIATDFKKKELLDVAISPRADYPHGMVQPAVLVLRRDGEVLYSWASVPSLSNFKGAKDRPSLKEIWEDVEVKLRGEEPMERKSYSKQTFANVILPKVFG